ncbi:MULTISPECIES: hypothetical protein [unclassified Flavobacterium]|jgi:hypothetical protein|uniref:hypothetical protein n=1 Tax=unclassified Flavobacterium TaxID=196869 RepID=UPI00057CF79F|nr:MULTISPECIES: hypothetical protein [unclassified Flavobacterium]KIA97414.1 hypothetical protein OA93_14230 [Flavobacterium sp. KMS]KIC01206.1 hypothetical protein OA88_15285 [Flavobacterium sp. JRM]MEA9414830.1 hypothetical protein [Flavobacterium sp. PL02]
MLKTILNLNGVELLSKNQQKNIVGKGQRGSGNTPRCSDGNWAPPGANPAYYPNYPCADIAEPVTEPCFPTFHADGTVTEC